ncbi:dihydropteroate synthase [Nocardioides insulae]|uniref:dihydropteroate synthase n=1 Tax=Nocardioides insulae TaxID=394734 RepID=UPI000410A1E1|nr:dihydropteroate synthase [Nocardioides insulae]
MSPLFSPIGRPRVMGIVNVTPDSFSDGGRFLATDDAVAHGVQLLDEGADLLDIGGESTRPGATRPLVEEELARVIPVISELSARGAVISVDTMRAEVAEASLRAGARIVNDVSGGLADPRILQVTADGGGTYVAMHWRAHSTQMQQAALLDYPRGVVTEVCDELLRRVESARAAGLEDDALVLDPGLGFSKSAEHNWQLVAGIDRVLDLGFPVLVGASRKTFLGHLLGELDAGAEPAADRLRSVGERESAHVAVNVVLAQRGVWCLRVHDVRAARDALAAVQKIQEVSA